MAAPSAFDAYALLLGSEHSLLEWLGPGIPSKKMEVTADVAFSILGYWAGHQTKTRPRVADLDLYKDRADWAFVMSAGVPSTRKSPSIAFVAPPKESVRATMAQIDERVGRASDKDSVSGAALFNKCAAMLSECRTIEARNQADADSDEARRRLAEKVFPPLPGTNAALAYEAALVSSAFSATKIRHHHGEPEGSSLKSFLTKLKDRRFHLFRYEEHHEGSDRTTGWELGGDVMGEASFCDMDDMSMNTRYIVAFVVPAAAALVKPSKNKARRK